MPRRKRCVLPGVPCHITQRGVDRRETFSSDTDRRTYLGLLPQNLPDSGVSVLGWCLMTNHVRRTGHLWQNRFFAGVLAPDHLWRALAYVERNPVRAGIVPHAITVGPARPPTSP